MTTAQITILLILAVTMAMFLWGRWRHDLVAMGALLACVIAGVVPGQVAFAGFGHPAVISVACVLVLGHGLQITGAVNVLAARLLPTGAGPAATITALITLAAVLSSFMNNVGALALLMPMAIQMAGKQNLPAGKVLMPLAFGSILGGMTTMIGTPPNLIVAGFRATTAAGSFGMFEFTPVGAAVALAGVAFVGLIGWRLVPERKAAGKGSFESGAYLSEVRLTEGSKAANKSVRETGQMLEEVDAQIVGMVRNGVRISVPSSRSVLSEGDILMIEVEPGSLAEVLSTLGAKLEEEVNVTDSEKDDAGTASADAPPEKPKHAEIVIQELVVSPNASAVRRSATDLSLRTRYGINLLAISRQGRQTVRRLRSARFRAGDVLLMQGPTEAVLGFASEFGCLPLAERDISVPKKGQALTASLVMALSIAATALGLLPAAISFALGALFYVLFGIVPVRSIYTTIDWSVIVLLGAMLPVADAMATTGAADTLAHFLMANVAQGNPIASLVVLLVVTMFLSDLMNNAATAAVMCPIASSIAAALGVNADGFLMAVAVGASCAFLTPIGHQNNTLILGPGGFHFGDYWRLGLLLEVIVLAVGVPVILWVWPL